MSLFKNCDRERGKCIPLAARINHSHSGAREREDERRGPGPGERHVHAHSSGHRLAAQLLADRRRRADQTIEAADVDRDEIVAMPFVARRKFARNGKQRGDVAIRQWVDKDTRTFSFLDARADDLDVEIEPLNNSPLLPLLPFPPLLPLLVAP